MYKVFLVEDEIVVREGIRNAIPWDETNFSFAGEAPDGEMALSIIQDVKPDILITDIRMPFMDGLALSRLVKKNIPWIKIIIISGHDEFEYAREAISIGVEEYLLKPISSQEMLKTLERVALRIDKEKEDLLSIENLKKQVRSSADIIRERWLNDFVRSRTPPENAVEEARELGINLIARSFITAHISLAPLGNKTGAGGDGIRGETKAEMIIKSIAANYPGVILFRSGKLGFGVIIADSTSVGLEESAYSFVQAVKYEVERTIAFRLVAEVGPEAARLGEIPESYAKAEKAARFDDTRPDARYSAVIMKAKGYIDAHFAEQDTSLHSVASNVGISPNHLSTVFAQETGERFIDYLTRCRIEKAKELLKGTAKRSLDIAEETGFSDPHYFSFIFKKATGLTPREYRLS